MQFDAVAQAPEVAGVLAVPPPPPPPHADKPKVKAISAVIRSRCLEIGTKESISTPKDSI